VLEEIYYSTLENIVVLKEGWREGGRVSIYCSLVFENQTVSSLLL